MGWLDQLFGTPTHDMTHADVKENSAKGVADALSGRYNIRAVEDRGRGKYDVYTKDGYRMTAEVGTRTNLFGEERSFFKWFDD